MRKRRNSPTRYFFENENYNAYDVCSKLINNIDSWQKNSLNKKTDSSIILEIIDKNDTKYKLMCENSDY